MSSQLSSQELNDMERSVEVETTKKATDWGVRRFQEWCDKRNKAIDFATCTSFELNDVLRKFYAEVKSKSNSALSPSALTGIRAAIHRKLKGAPYSRDFNILSDSAFQSANVMFDTKVKLYRKAHNKKPAHKEVIETVQKLWIYFARGMNTDTTHWIEKDLLQLWTPRQRGMEGV